MVGGRSSKAAWQITLEVVNVPARRLELVYASRKWRHGVATYVVSNKELPQEEQVSA